eukprot:5945166-Pleurochrysis_carterae.AAC.1
MRARARSRSRFAGGLDGGGERGRFGQFHWSLRHSQLVDKKVSGLGQLPAATDHKQDNAGQFKEERPQNGRSRRL